MAILDLFVFIFIIINYRQTKGLVLVGIIFVLEFIYAINYAFELLAVNINNKILFNHIQYLGIPFIAIVWYYVTKTFENPRYVMTFKKAVLLMALPVIVSITVQLYPWTEGIYYGECYIDTVNTASNLEFAVLVFVKGPLYYISVLYNSVFIGLVSWTYFKVWRAKKGFRSKESFWLMAGSLISFLTVIFVFLSNKTSGIDGSLYLLQLIAYGVLLVMFKYETIDLKPSAHRVTFEMSSDPMMIIDDSYEIISWNSAFAKFIERPVLYRTNINDFFVNKEIVEAVQTEKAFGFRLHDRHYILETTDVRNRAGHKTGYIVRFNDMTSYIQRIEMLDYEATHDELTNIYNRRAFIDKTEKYLDEKRTKFEPFALVMLDIDDFKKINDTYGHVIGDCILEEFATVIKKELPDKVLFARYGGEEFLILFQNMSDEVTYDLTNHLRQVIADHNFRIQDLSLHIEVSAGISYNRTGENVSLKEYINKTDEAMYMSKKAGKNRITSIR